MASMNSFFDEDSSSEEEPVKLSSSQESPRKSVIAVDDEDDDDDDDDDLGNDAINKDTSTPKRVIEELDDDDDDDDDDDEDKPNGRGANDGSVNQSDDKSKSEPVQYNPDEEDVEFDGDGAIVGSSARPSSNKQLSQKQQQQQKLQPKHMTVLDAQKPPSNTTLHMTKLPNIVGIQTEAFDRETYSAMAEEKEFKGFVPHMIRWRYAKDEDGNYQRDEQGKLIRESNTRLVKWEDGSFSLQVGKEVFQIDTVQSTQPNGFAGVNGYLYLSQKATFRNEDETEEENGGGTVLECMGAVNSRLTPRPSSLQSEAHKSLTLAVRQKTIKRARIAQYVTQEDPEKAKADRIRNKQDLDKTYARKHARSNYNSPFGGGGGHRRPGMNRRYMEDDEDGYDSINIKRLKRRNYEDDMMDYGSDDDDDDDDEDDDGPDRFRQGKLAALQGKKRRQQQQQRRRHDDDDDEEEEEEEEFAFGQEESDDEEEIKRTNKSTGKKRAHQALVDDDD